MFYLFIIIRSLLCVSTYVLTSKNTNISILHWLDANGNRHLVKGPVQPRDVWIDNDLRYFVVFNAFNQPLGKGGSILVSFLGDVAKRESFCPVGLSSWHKLKKGMRSDILTIVRVCHLLFDFNKCFLFYFMNMQRT